MDRRNRRVLLHLDYALPSWTATATGSTENVPISPSYAPTPITSTTTRHMLQPPPPPTMDALFSSSLAVIVLVLLGALFFLGFISLYIRRFAIAEEFSNADDSNSYYRQVRPPAMNLPPPLPLRQPSCAAIHKGLDPAVIGSLPTRAYSGAAKYQMECPVCLSEFEEGETIKVIPHCRHVFHVQCIDKWLYSHVSCPVCRAFCAAH